MREVMMKAQELAEAILNSETYGKMKKLEGEVRHDETAARLLSDMIEKRQAVENILSSANMQPEELSRASQEMEEALHDSPCRLGCLAQDSRQPFGHFPFSCRLYLRQLFLPEEAQFHSWRNEHASFFVVDHDALLVFHYDEDPQRLHGHRHTFVEAVAHDANDIVDPFPGVRHRGAPFLSQSGQKFLVVHNRLKTIK